jgi:excisionase family DNA binding protein
MKFYTPQEVADICGVNRITIYRWIEAGKIEAKTMGFKQRKYIAEVDVPTFIRKNRS